jgi:2-haloacid dehalogenase/putative hydrolase of the HAD superfamily
MLSSLIGRKAFAEVDNVLCCLSKKYLLCVGSNSDTLPLIENIRSNRLKFDCVFTSQILQSYKPKAIFYEKILFGLGLDASEVVFVGDSLRDDIMGPRQLGIHSVWLNRKRADCVARSPDTTISNLLELNNIL